MADELGPSRGRGDAGAVGLHADWIASAGQTANTVVQLGTGRYRVTFNATIGYADTLYVLNPTDRAGNLGGTITLETVE